MRANYYRKVGRQMPATVRPKRPHGAGDHSDWQLRRRYGITKETQDEKRVEQNNLCAICQNELQPGRGTHTDHDHTTGRFRGLLCQHCNQGLGHFFNDPKLLESAIQYLSSM